jgi:hypothetical protein
VLAVFEPQAHVFTKRRLPSGFGALNPTIPGSIDAPPLWFLRRHRKTSNGFPLSDDQALRVGI